MSLYVNPQNTMKKLGFFLFFTALLFVAVVPGQAQQNQFGGAVAIGDDEVFVAETQNTTSAGSVYIYHRDEADGAWKEHAQLFASDNDPNWDDRFGRALATDGKTLVVGATKRGGTRGGVYFFEKNDAGAWGEVARFAAEDGADGDHLGRVLAISDGFAFVTSLGHNESSGAVYVYRRDAGTGAWAYHSKLTGSTIEPGEYFGMALALDGDKALIAAPPHNEQTGVVFAYHYDAAQDAWTATGTLVAEGLEKGHRFGAALSLEGDVALVGSPRYGGNLGAVYAYRYEAASGTWMPQARLEPSDGDQGRLGTSMVLHGDELWVGSPRSSGFQGAVYVYQREGDSWTETKKMAAADIQGGDFFAGTLAMGGTLAVAGALGDDHGAGTAIIFERDASGQWVEKNTLANEEAGLASIVGGQVNCADGTADRFDCDQVDLVSFLSVKDIGGGRGVITNDIWGWTDPQTDKEYALVGRLDGTAFVDISDPHNPLYLGSLALTEGANSSLWRDIKVYKDHAFIVADNAGEHGVQVFDLTQLRTVTGAPVTFEETAHYDGIHSAHNIVINEDAGYAFTVCNSGGGETCGLHMIDIREPTEPTFAGCFADPATGRASTGYSHDAQCVIYHGPDTEHRDKEICFGANETALSIADVTDKDNTVALARASYPNVGYSHQGWLSEDHRFFFMNDELDEVQGKTSGTRTLVWDVTDLDDPQMLKEVVSENQSSDHNLYIKGNLMYQSNYLSGLRIFDITDPANPVEVGYFDTVPYGEDEPAMMGSWSNYPYFKSGVIAVTSMKEGVFFLKKRTVDI